MDYCKNCKRWTCGAQGTTHGMSIPCGNYIPPTNADRIRAMSDEELAAWLTFVEQRVLTRNPALERPAKEKDWLYWLKHEVKKDG